MKRLLCAVLLLCAYASAQQVNPNQIQPSSVSGYVLTTPTANQAPSWQPSASGCPGGCVLQAPTATQGVSQPASTSFYMHSYDPESSIPGSASIQGLPVRMDSDFSQFQVNSGSGQEGTPAGELVTSNYYGLTQNTQNTFGGVPAFEYGSFLAGIENTINRYNSGQTFGTYDAFNCHGAGDCIAHYETVTADGGVNRIDDEGVKYADSLVQEDPNVYTAAINGAVTTGATTIPTGCTIGCNTQGADRLLLDTAAGKKLTGTFNQASWAATVNNVPFAISDPNATYPVSTIFALCYSGADNGAGGAAGCPSNGSAPSGYIPPQANSPTQQSPAASIATTILPSYPNQPSYFCTPSTIQTTTPGAACYLPASGVVCISDPQEYETVNYTYSGGTLTLLNLQFSHLNGMTAAVGGMCGYAVEASNSIYSGGGTNGVESQVFPIEGSPNATTILDITQRTNEGYGSIAIGNSQNDWGFSTTASGFNSSGALVSINVANPPNSPGVPVGSYLGCLTALNNLSVTITTANSTYNGTYPLTQTGCTSFTYQPSPAVSGTQPSTGTIAFSNMQYTIYPSARVISVSDSYVGVHCNATTSCVNGKFYLQPNTMAWANGDAVREPHYQQMNITGDGNPRVVERYMREQYLGPNGAGTQYYGVMGTNMSGVSYVNNFPSSQYIGHGGTYPVPTSAYGEAGVWDDAFDITSAPENAILDVLGWKPDIGASSPFSDFTWLSISATLPGSFAGFAHDYCRYVPSYNLANRGQALTSGLFYCGQDAPGTLISHQSVTAWEFGQLRLDWSLAVPDISANNVSVTALSNSPSFAVATIGTPGSTTYNYEIVAHDQNGGSTVPVAPAFFNTGNATLNTTNYNQICVFRNPGVYSYDFLKQVGGVYQSMATNVAVGNGASFGQVPNYTCENDQGGSTSAYTMPTVNTTGSVEAATLGASVQITTPSLLATGIVDGTTPIAITTGASNALGGAYHSGYTFNNDGATAVTYTLPTAAPGLQYCVANDTGATGTLKVATSATGQFIDNTGANTASGGYVISGGALGDAGCFIGMSTTNWKLYVQSGTWTTH